MPRKKVDTELLKAQGVVDVKRNGDAVEFYLDPKKMSEPLKKSIAALGEMKSLDKASANNVYNAPWIPSFYEGAGKSANMPVHDKMKLAMMYFSSDPMVGKIIEIMKVFANDGFKNQSEDADSKEFIDEWCEKVQMDVVLDWIFLEYFRSGNVPTLREFINFDPAMFKTKTNFNKATAAAKKDWTKSQIPIAYTVINPLHVKVLDGENNAWKDTLYGTDSITVEGFSKEDTNDIEIKSRLTNEVKNILKGDVTDKPLSSRKYQRILRMRQPYEAYGSVMMERAFNALYEKNKLRQIDLDTMNSSITQLIKVTVGDKDYPATPRQVKAITNAFQNVGKSQMIFWNHTLTVEAIKLEPRLIDESKYSRVDTDIRNAFGISEILLGGGDAKTNFATSYLSLKAFVTNLIDARRAVERWLTGQYKDIANVVGLKSIPKPTFNPLSLTDEIAEKQLLMQLVDRGIISYETAQLQLGFDPSIERKRRTAEKPLIEDGILGFMGNPYMQAAVEGIVNTDEKSDKNVKKEDKKDPDNSDQRENQKNRAHNKAKDPSVKIGDEGRPKGQGPGKKMPKRKSPGVKSGASIIEEDNAMIENNFKLRREIDDILVKEEINKKALNIIKESK